MKPTKVNNKTQARYCTLAQITHDLLEPNIHKTNPSLDTGELELGNLSLLFIQAFFVQLT